VKIKFLSPADEWGLVLWLLKKIKVLYKTYKKTSIFYDKLIKNLK
jgi:hypothetical protein